MVKTHFLEFPRELRDLIYLYVLPEVDLTKLPTKGLDGTSTFIHTNGVLLANHQLRREAKEIFWRLLPNTTVTLAPAVHIHCLNSPAYARLRRETQFLVVRMEQYNRRLPAFTLTEPGTCVMRYATDNTNGFLLHIFRVMPALRHVTCDIEWKPNNAPSILLPRERNDMLRELRRVTIRDDPMIGWDVECYIVDATRWKKECKGGVIFSRKSVAERSDSEEHSPSSAT
jgi:DNA polymerase elongation subunit (family B)